MEGGCCALVVVYLLGKVYVANAGDSRYGGHTLWGGGTEESEVAGGKNQRLEEVRRGHRQKEGPERATWGRKIGVWMLNPKGHYREGLVFLEFSTRGPKRAEPQPFLSLGRAIIVRNGEIIPMSREFTPETERQRLKLLVSVNSTPDSHSWLSLVPVCTLHPEDSPSPTTQTAPYRGVQSRAGGWWRT